ncbi:hypothetical protein Moror_16244 [Moniliophthora roreri MCA 2997]|uniref:Uncharacterized protein n=2 Tax=Moniliophthora roreri TaxID=221103 RepID=V2X945_MONRO|nr:hypothetical protein Moror_16244 [Moniliophthora roreri MCA 2997]
MLNHVHGDQVHQTITVNLGSKIGVESAGKYDEFEYVKRGHIIIVKDLYFEILSDWDWKWHNGDLVAQHKARRTISTVKLLERQSKFTAIMYEGSHAHSVWEQEFQRLTRSRKLGSFQLFGINKSEIPVLIFHHELLPLAHFNRRDDFWMSVYIHHLTQNKRCLGNRLWMNTSEGVLGTGPDGPSVPCCIFNADESIAVPSIVDMLKDDISFSFYSKLGPSVDCSVLRCAQWHSKYTYLDSDDLFLGTTKEFSYEDQDDSGRRRGPLYLGQHVPRHLPENVIGRLRFDTIYSRSLGGVARWPQEAGTLWKFWSGDWEGCETLVDETIIAGGLTRFKVGSSLNLGPDFTGRATFLSAHLDWSMLGWAWLSQHQRVFNALESTINEESFFTVDPPTLVFQYTQDQPSGLMNSLGKSECRPTMVEAPPLYLFFYPPPTTLSELMLWKEGQTHFWSFDEVGESKLSKEECKQHGLPGLAPAIKKSTSIWPRSWPTYVYNAIRNWQIARGFDPRTTDFARYMGCPELEIIGAVKHVHEARFEVIETQEKNAGSLWEAFAGSVIRALGF